MDHGVIGYQRWVKFLFLHFEVPQDALRPLVPSRLDLDTYQGRAFVSVTPFTVRNARLRGMPPLPGLSWFHELNVRTYVRNGEDRGVWFFSLDAASPAAAAVARISLRLPYCYARMNRSEEGATFRYDSVRVMPPPQASFSGSWSARGRSWPSRKRFRTSSRKGTCSSRARSERSCSACRCVTPLAAAGGGGGPLRRDPRAGGRPAGSGARGPRTVFGGRGRGILPPSVV